MNSEKHNSEIPQHAVITLIDGRKLPLILKSIQPAELVDDELSLDTTGQYFSTVKNPKSLSESEARQVDRQYNHHLFTENAWFLLDHTAEIFSDSRMFLAPVKVQNGLAYTGTSGFKNPTVGIYLEWWLNNKEAAVDKNGNLVWYISGSPLSGSNCCRSVTPDGVQVNTAQQCSFSSIWSSFMSVNTRYTEAKQIAAAFSLEEVLIKLRGEGYKLRLLELQHEMIHEVMRWNYLKLRENFDSICTRLSKILKANRKMQLEANKEAVLGFARAFFEKESLYKAAHEVFVVKHKRLKQQLHADALNGDYKTLLAEAGRESRTLKSELSDMGNNFMLSVFGKNINEISLKDVLNYAKPRLK